MTKKKYSLTVKDLSKLLGINSSLIDPTTLHLFNKYNFNYFKSSTQEKESVFLNVIKKVYSNSLSKSGKYRKDEWEKGWQENLENFRKSNYDLNELVPKYIRPNQTLRLFYQYVQPEDPRFELHWYNVFRNWIFSAYLKDVKNIYEFGCGSGYNLSILANLFPRKKIVGLDWVESSKNIVNNMANSHNLNVKGYVFNMFEPDYKLKIEEDSAVITLGGLEQLGKNYKKFSQYILKNSPQICIHMEPFYEIYNSDILFDHLAIEYIKKRNYLYGYIDHLKKLESQQKIKIIKLQRVQLGSLFHEGYSYVIWTPKGSSFRNDK